MGVIGAGLKYVAACLVRVARADSPAATHTVAARTAATAAAETMALLLVNDGDRLHGCGSDMQEQRRG